ncbi:MAG: hypothetical protein F4X97_02180 [Boseongicola sp. SB0662_bin_57]|nr:hypothetical protein [Boseongicola sp. SB0662_bin_57]
MLLTMLTRTKPHPPREGEPCALGPSLAASLAIGSAAYVLVARGARHSMATAFLFALTALVSHGPQAYFDAALSRIWPAAIVAQLAIAAIMCLAMCRAVRLMRTKNRVAA